MSEHLISLSGENMQVKRYALYNALNEHRDELYQKNLEITKESIREQTGTDDTIMKIRNTIASLDTVINVLVKKTREWYTLYNPELEHEISDHKAFLMRAKNAEPRDGTMGIKLPEKQISELKEQIALALNMMERRESLVELLEQTMNKYAPNVTTVAGAALGAKLIEIAGSFEKLAYLPSGTIQLLGAETALFRHLRNKKAKPPKHGVLFNHKLIQSAPRKLHGKIARALADSISIAARVDLFKGEYIGEKLLEKASRHSR
jgi:nucleolar protein 56